MPLKTRKEHSFGKLEDKEDQRCGANHIQLQVKTIEQKQLEDPPA